MAKSFTKRKATKPDIKEVIEITEAASLYVGIWTKQETTKLINRELVIIPTRSGLQVGKYTVKSAGTAWSVYNTWGDVVNSFTSKKSAVYWCVLAHSNRIIMSQKLYHQDERLSKYTQDHTHYLRTRKRAIQNGDYFTVDVCDARLAKIQSQLEDARNDLEKTLNSAKYLKGIWEKPL